MKKATTQEKVRARAEEMRDRLQEGIEAFGQRVQDEAQGVETRVKEGIEQAVGESKRRDGRLGRAPGVIRRPPSGRPPSRRSPSA